MAKPRPEGVKSSGGRAIAAVVIAVIGLPIVYVLSVGPAAWLSVNNYLSPQMEHMLEAFYFPLAWAVNNSEWASSVMIAYMSLWVEM